MALCASLLLAVGIALAVALATVEALTRCAEAAVCTVAVLSALGFLVGAALIVVSMRVDPSVLGITQIGAIYCYLLGIVTAIASFALMVLDALAFVIILIVTKIKNGGREK